MSELDPSPALAAPIPLTLPATVRPRGRIVAVVGAKGGVGTTQIAVNLAAESAARALTLLVDGDFGKGDVAGYLDLQPEFSISHILDRIGTVDREMLLGHATKHRSGLYLLPQPYDLTDLDPPPPAELRRLLDQAAMAYDIVVVDLGSQVDLPGVAGVSEADLILLIVTPKVPALRDALRTLALWTSLGTSVEKIRLVVNQGTHRHAVPDGDIVRLLGIEIFATVARDPDAFGSSAFRGALLREMYPRADGTRDILALWTAVSSVLATLKPTRAEGINK